MATDIITAPNKAKKVPGAALSNFIFTSPSLGTVYIVLSGKLAISKSLHRVFIGKKVYFLCKPISQGHKSNDKRLIAEWLSIKKLVERGVSNGKIVCLLSVEHLYEASGKTNNAATEQSEYIKSLACGYIFTGQRLLLRPKF